MQYVAGRLGVGAVLVILHVAVRKGWYKAVVIAVDSMSSSHRKLQETYQRNQPIYFAKMGLLLPVVAALFVGYVSSTHSQIHALHRSLTSLTSSFSPPSTISSSTPSPLNQVPSYVASPASPPSTTPASATATSGHGASSNNMATNFALPPISCSSARLRPTTPFSR
jgi:hypothetical protein